MKKKSSVIGVLFTFLVLGALIIGIFGSFYFLITDANKKGNMLDGSWNYNGNTALEINMDEKTYSLNVDNINEKGKIIKVELEKSDTEKDTLNYNVTFDGNGEYVVNMVINFSDNEKDILSFSSKKYVNNYKFTRIVKESK